MNYEDYLEDMKNVQEFLLNYIDTESNKKMDYQFLINYINNQKIRCCSHKIKLIMHFICAVSNSHHRYSNFIDKIEQILHFLKEDILKFFSNLTIYNIFKENKRILLFLFKDKIITFDPLIKSKIKDDQQFFSPEINKFLHQEESFEEKRKKGENDNYICTLIQNDLIEDFVSYINKTNFSIKMKIPPSIYETNQFLRNQEPTLIEYATFFGSIQIFKFLRLNNADLSSSLWMYAIHSNNAELIHLLEEYNIEPEDKSYKKCLKESIKCHHNEIARYIEDNYLQNNAENDRFIFSQSIKYYNFALIQNNLINKSSFYLFCKHDYFYFVDLFSKSIDINMKYSIIHFTVYSVLKFILYKILNSKIESNFKYYFFNEV